MSEPSPPTVASDEARNPAISTPLPAGRRPLLQRLSLSVRDKIILPYLLLTLAAAVMGILIVTRLIATSIDERFTNQLLEAGRVASDGVVRQENRLLELLRAMTQTTGVASAVEAQDAPQLRELLEVQAYNANIDSVIVLNQTGDVILRLDALRAFNPEVIDSFQSSGGGNLASLPMVAPVLAGQVDSRGDKYAGLVNSEIGPLLYTTAPVLSSSDARIVGAIMVGIRLDRLLARPKAESLADIVIYTAPGEPVGSTIPEWRSSEQYGVLILSSELYEQVIAMPDETPLNTAGTLTLFERDYRMAYTPMIVRGRATGVLGVLLPNNFIVRTISTSRTTFIAIFSVALVLVVVVGSLIAGRILRPINELADLAHLVTQGNFSRRARIITRDEIGDLAASFNRMTDWLQKALHDVRDENARTLAILGSIADGVVVRDLEGQTILMNDAARELLSIDGEFDEMRVDVLEALRFTASEPVRVPFDERTISISAAPVMPRESNEIIGTVFTLRDVTREAMAERTKDNFLNQIGHEFRTPLTSIAGYAQVLKHGGDRLSDEKYAEAVDTIYDKTEEVRLIIDQLIDLTALHSGDFTLQTRVFDLTELVKSRLKAWGDEFKRAGLRLSFTGKQTIEVEADHKRLSRALDAVLQNAVTFSPDGGPLKVRVARDGDRACVSVSDPGVGIQPRAPPPVWSRFYEGTPVDRKGKVIDVRGMGQGLHMVKSIIDVHGGSVELDSQPGKGTTIRVYLPLVK